MNPEALLADAQITPEVLLPIFYAVKDNFMSVLAPLVIIFAILVGAWLLPMLVSAVHKK